MQITKENILNQLQNTSNELAVNFDDVYKVEIGDIANEISKGFSILEKIINYKDQDQVSDQFFQSACIFWTGLNTILSAVDLFRRGYSKEPQMLLRNSLEIFAAAYDINKNLDRYNDLIDNPEKFSSTDSIGAVKEIHPILGNFYGILSDRFAHVSAMHLIPHDSVSFAFGGIFDPKKQDTIALGITTFALTFDILNSVLEISMIKYIDEPKFWKKVSESNYEYNPDMVRAKKLLYKMGTILNSMKEPDIE